ncbi:MAG TPA: alpha-1,6-glucosidase domain-containing protein, partial [Draconibacterium sp.]|nr:alpha-1,6-glucosidase domain-containing protein [Draconibacterium sp.]
GFVSGLSLREEAIKFGITAAVYHPEVNYGYIESVHSAWASEPNQCINYVSCHDNYTLWDKLKQSLPKASDEELRKSVKLAGALVLTSQGVPLLHAGVDFCRTKGGNGNSYKSPDAVNQIDWSRKNEYIDVFEYFQGLIQLRKKHPAFRLPKAEMIRQGLHFCAEYKIGVVSYCLDGSIANDSWSKIFLIFNGNNEEVEIPLPEGSYMVVANANSINEEGIETIAEKVTVDPISVHILVQKEN